MELVQQFDTLVRQAHGDGTNRDTMFDEKARQEGNQQKNGDILGLLSDLELGIQELINTGVKELRKQQEAIDGNK